MVDAGEYSPGSRHASSVLIPSIPMIDWYMSLDTYHCDNLFFIFMFMILVLFFFVSPLGSRYEEYHAIAPVSDVTRAERSLWAHRGQSAVTFLEIQAVRRLAAPRFFK